MEQLPKDFGSHRQRNRRIVQFVMLALLADLGLVLIELAVGLNPLTDMAQRPLLYLYGFGGTLIVFGVFGAMVGSREDLLEAMALRDSLTGLFNVRYFKLRLDEELAASQRHQTPLSYVLLDIDHFKQVNDSYGHPVGDHVLRTIGQLIQSELREGEMAARIGGEEFALLLPHTNAEQAGVGAERIRTAIAHTVIRMEKHRKQLSVTVSAGVACTVDQAGYDRERLYQHADCALYQAKSQGRNRTVIATQKPDTAGGETPILSRLDRSQARRGRTRQQQKELNRPNSGSSSYSRNTIP